ncbi:unnamed protein product [Closterium sp. Yama58-4]|nr:unnamed protein product [Closterium sp. Yama58-4]
MAAAGVLPLPTAIVVRDARSDAVLAQFLGGKPAGEVCDALERLTGSPGCLVLGDKASQGAPLVLTESDVIQSGTYHWRVAVTRSSSQPTAQPTHPPYNHTRHRHHDWSSQLAASILAILILGSGIQLLIMLAALPFCGYRWSCAFSHYRSFISFIDGPFKVFAFAAAGKQGEAGSRRGSDTGLVVEPGLAAARGLGKPGSAFLSSPRDSVNFHDSLPVASTTLSHDNSPGSPCAMPFSSSVAFFTTSPPRSFASRGSLHGKISSSLSAYFVRRSISDGGGNGDVSKRKED